MLALILGAVAQDAARGEVLAGIAGCAACHATDGIWSGGYAIETRFGTFRGPNITETGFSAADFERALREGRSPEGRAYWPAFPYTSYTRLGDSDVGDLWAWFSTLPANDTPDRPHLGTPPRFLLSMWRALEFRPGRFEPDPEMSGEWNRGATLVEGPGHCGECHTPRNLIGGMRERLSLRGSRAEPEPAPDISAGGLVDWSDTDLLSFFVDGIGPDGDVVGGAMREVVLKGTSRLGEEDRRAIVTYLRTVE